MPAGVYELTGGHDLAPQFNAKCTRGSTLISESILGSCAVNGRYIRYGTRLFPRSTPCSNSFSEYTCVVSAPPRHSFTSSKNVDLCALVRTAPNEAKAHPTDRLYALITNASFWSCDIVLNSTDRSTHMSCFRFSNSRSTRTAS